MEVEEAVAAARVQAAVGIASMAAATMGRARGAILAGGVIEMAAGGTGAEAVVLDQLAAADSVDTAMAAMIAIAIAAEEEPSKSAPINNNDN